MQFRLLGPLDLAVAAPVAGLGPAADLGPPKQRAVLAALLVDAGRPVTVETLVDRVWGDEPTPGVRSAIYGHVARIRQALSRTAPVDRVPRVVRRGGGYLIDVDPDDVDLHRFRSLVDRARAAGTDDEHRVDLLREALTLWRGTPLAGVPGSWAARTRDALEQQRLSVLVTLAEAELRLGRHREVLDDLREWAVRHPLVEPLVSALMQGLFAAGRQAEALECYAATRGRLADELGTQPGPDLRHLHEAMLRGKYPLPAGSLTPAPAPDVVSQPAAPAQLPGVVHPFTGREAEIDALDRMLPGTGHEPPVVGVVVLSGTAGVGKTALAVHWAHRNASRFPDGQLHVDLRGYDPDRPLTPAEALAVFLRGLGVAELPTGLAEREALYRTLLAGRRMLVVIDNAAGSEDVRPLLPGAGSCCVLVTSRDSLSALVARHGAHRLDLDLLPAADAVALLRALVGQRVDDDPPAAAVFAERCARLPLALRIGAEYAAERGAVPLAVLVDDLADERDRLDLLDAGGDEHTALRAVFSWSHRHLPAGAALAYRRLGLHPGRDTDPYAAAALLGTDPATTGRLLATLCRAHLVREAPAGRYVMHDLLRTYARELADEEPPAARRAAVHRLLDHMVASAGAAMDVLAPYEAHRRPAVPAPPGPVEVFADPAAARDWLDVNRDNLLATAAYATGHGWFTHTVMLSVILYRYFEVGAYFAEAIRLHRQALLAARRCGDRAGEATIERQLGSMAARLARFDEATAHFTRSLVLFEEVGDASGIATASVSLANVEVPRGEPDRALHRYLYGLRYFEAAGDWAGAALALGNLAGVSHLLGRYEESLRHGERALLLFEKVGDRAGVGRTLGNLGTVYERVGRYEEAVEHNRRALALFAETGNRTFQGRALGNLSSVHQRLGRYDEAVRYAEEALTLMRQVSDREGKAAVLDNLGTVHGRTGRLAEALRHHGEALDLAREVGDRPRELSVRNGLAEVLLRTGDTAAAHRECRTALALGVDLGDRFEQARALETLGDVHDADGVDEEAGACRSAALALYTDLRVPEADRLRARLAPPDRPAA